MIALLSAVNWAGFVAFGIGCLALGVVLGANAKRWAGELHEHFDTDVQGHRGWLSSPRITVNDAYHWSDGTEVDPAELRAQIDSEGDGR